MSLLSLREVTRTVIPQDQPALTILNGIDLEIEPGDHVSIVGRSGSGNRPCSTCSDCSTCPPAARSSSTTGR